MSEPSDTPIPVVKANRQKKWMWVSTALFLILGVGFLIYWRVWGRFEESTRDAYVTGNQIVLTPQVSGIVTTIYVDNTELVEEGEPILELDRHDYEIALEGAKSRLSLAVREVVGMFLQVEKLSMKSDALMQDLVRASLDYDHRAALVGDGSVSREDFEHSETAFLKAYALFEENERHYDQALALVHNTTVPTHPHVEQAKALLRHAFLQLHRCTVLAPAKGIVTQRKAQVGERVKAESPLMALVPLDQIWVDANFREVSLKNFRMGQPVELISDMYGDAITFHGQLIGLNPGTGSVFSVLPPQNATGNWIKIVQRVPVKVSLDPEELLRYPLVLGLSMKVKVDTHQRSGLRLPESSSIKPIYLTHAYEEELEGVEALIEKIIRENSDESE